MYKNDADWIVRIYLETSQEGGNLKVKEILDSYPFADLCNVTDVLERHGLSNRSIFPMTWRFLPLLDPTVDRLMSRDSDSVILSGEVEAVQQWLTQRIATFLVMRDKKFHNVEMLGGTLRSLMFFNSITSFITLLNSGLWGAKIYQRRLKIKEAAMQLFKNAEHTLERGFDQAMLAKFIWPLAANDTVN